MLLTQEISCQLTTHYFGVSALMPRDLGVVEATAVAGFTAKEQGAENWALYPKFM